MKKIIFLLFCFSHLKIFSQHGNKFEPLGTLLPTPNEYRTASGAPGPKYWQQRADYDITCELDEKNLRISGNETITYHNNSPDELTYLWLQLDENLYSKDRNANYQYNNAVPEKLSEQELKKWEDENKPNDYGVNLVSVTDASGKKLHYTVNRTMMRIDLPTPLKSKQQYVFKISWNYKITNRMVFFGRGGYEPFPDGNNLYTITHWYPRMCLYSDYQGWHNQQYNNKEFALTFGNFKVRINLPADHIAGATGECKNYKEVLTPTQLSRLQKAQSANEPIDIVTLDEAKQNERSRSTARKTWMFEASNVRDFAWMASRKFAWDGMSITIAGKKILCMSYYGKEAYPLYHKTSTQLVAHTLKTFSNHTIPYPYPVAQSVEASNGIEFPMICFNYGRAEKDGSVKEEMRVQMIRVVIHEVGHNFFPMIVNSDERQWAWMDEGFDSFLSYIAEKAWDSTITWPRGPAKMLVPYMKKPKGVNEPIMTYSDNAIEYATSAYHKPATALNVLRETIMGHERFDTAFKTYAKRWAFKQPTPADFFRTMEDASADDLDWFWRGWFYTTDVCDISIDTVKFFTAGAGKYFYQVEMSNKGGLVMPVIIQLNYEDGTNEVIRIPAQVWRHNESRLTKSYMRNKKVSSIQLDPFLETVDIDETNNVWKHFGEPKTIPF
ncbi:MAG: M1 family metallopeptidase [Chitinophagaceae bacterium]|nr:M1 family metallopeptidase [Chitinophagaceae bacterium]